MISRVNFWGRLILLWLAVWLFLLFGSIGARPGYAAPAMNVYDLIAAVNQLRAANNLPPYEVNGSLMAAAQAHSEYQASIGQITHTGAGGTHAKDRAIAAGYGGGATVSVSENIAGGSSLTIQGAVLMWQGDALHLNTMLGASYTHVGAGIAKAGGLTYYTLDVGYIAGSPGSGSTSAARVDTSANAQPIATVVAFNPVMISTPQEDGSIVHIVRSGQSLWSIAATYEIELQELLALNNLAPGAWIFPGDKLIIQPAGSETAAVSPEPEQEQEQESTALPTTTPTRRSRLTQTPSSIAMIGPATPEAADIIETKNLPPLVTSLPINAPLMVIAVLVLGGTVLIVLGYLLKRSS